MLHDNYRVPQRRSDPLSFMIDVFAKSSKKIPHPSQWQDSACTAKPRRGAVCNLPWRIACLILHCFCYIKRKC
jgi:hypothetical protein